MSKVLILGLLIVQVLTVEAQQAATYYNSKPEIPQIDYTKFKIKGDLNAKQRQGEYLYYNQLGELVRKERYKEGKLIFIERYVPKAYHYNNDSLLIEFRRYDVNGLLRTSTVSSFMEEWAPKDYIVKYVYDKKRNLLEEQVYESKDRLMIDDSSPAVTKYEYNKSGLLVKKSYLDHNEKLMEDIMGAAFITYKYDAKGNLIETNAYGIDGELEDSFYGASTIKNMYDDSNQLIEKRLLTPSGVLAQLDMAGAPIEKYTYNSGRQMIYSEGWATEKDKIGSYKYYYNKDGLLEREEFYESTELDNYLLNFYDDHKNLVKIKSFDSQSKLLSEVDAGISIEIEGWEWENRPSIHFDRTAHGRISFVFRIDERGEIVGYANSERDGDQKFMDFCIDVLNNLKLKKLNDSNDLEGTVEFIKL